MSTVTRKDRAPSPHWLAAADRLGLLARALLYLLIGGLAVLVAAGHSTAETDQWGAMQQLDHDPAGHVLLWVIGVGLAGYAAERLTESAVGVPGQGRRAGPRLTSAVRGAIYAALSVTAFEIALGRDHASQAAQQRSFAAAAMRHGGGRVAVALVGAIVLVVGLSLIGEGITRKFEHELDLSSLSPVAHRFAIGLGVFGTVARGVVVALAGVFAVQAAWDYSPGKAAGLDGALRALRDTPAGPWLLGLVALGLVAFGLYGFAEARWHRA